VERYCRTLQHTTPIHYSMELLNKVEKAGGKDKGHICTRFSGGNPPAKDAMRLAGIRVRLLGSYDHLVCPLWKKTSLLNI